jgi:pimeloyl-ACP methyl ester carboxylesterase
MIEPFTIDIPHAELEELRRRLRDTRWPDDVGDDWERGTRPSTLRTFLGYWAEEFDWRAVEARVNGYEHVRVDVETPAGPTRIHAMLAGDPAAPPLLLLHGWPDSFLRFEKLIPLLGDRFRLIMPSIPGYGFSDRPTAPGAGPAWVADRMAGLMTELGHPVFGVHGGDIGSSIGDHLAARHPERVSKLHLTSVPTLRLGLVDPADLTPEERDYAAWYALWTRDEGAYASEMRTKPQTIAASLTDSPAGLGSWFLEKYRAWGDGDDPLEMFGLELLATNATLYWVTGTAASAARYYFETRMTGPAGFVSAPVGVAVFPGDISVPPRVFAERFYDVERWIELPRGGHFAAWEQPELLAEELRAFFGV